MKRAFVVEMETDFERDDLRAAEDLRGLIMDALGFPVCIEKNPEMLQVRATILCRKTTMMTDNCPACGANLALVGRTHRCVPPEAVGSYASAPAWRPPSSDDLKDVEATLVKHKPGRPRLEDSASTIEQTKPWKKMRPRISRRT